MTLELYYFESCPFCQKVLSFLKAQGISGMTKKDIKTTPLFEKELLALGGKKQVPCLMIDGKPLYESDDIISWLKKNHA